MSLRPFPRPGLPVPFLLLSFKGQLVLQPAADGSLCKVRVNTHTPVDAPHTLTVTFLAKRPNGTVKVVTPQMSGPLEGTFSIEYNTGSNGVFGFFPDPSFDRNKSNQKNRDLRWAFNLQDAKEFHDPTDCRLDCGFPNEPGFVIKDGVFYAFDTSNPASLKITRQRPGDNLPIPSVATIIGAMVKPPNQVGGQSVLVKWKQGGTAKSILLPRTGGGDPDPDGTVYTIAIENVPPSGIDIPHDELSLYYELVKKVVSASLTNVPPNEQFILTAVQLGSFDGDRIPCMSVLIDS